MAMGCVAWPIASAAIGSPRETALAQADSDEAIRWS
jgi:hypothetical protein